MVSVMSAEEVFLDLLAGFCVTMSSSSDLLVPLADVFSLSVLLKVSTGLKIGSFSNNSSNSVSKSYDFFPAQIFCYCILHSCIPSLMFSTFHLLDYHEQKVLLSIAF